MSRKNSSSGRKKSSPPAPDMFDAAELARVAERIRARFERMRAEREAFWASKTEPELLAMRLEESRRECDPMLSVFLGAAVPMWIHEMRSWSPDAIVQKAHSLVDIIACSQGIAAMADPDARGTARPGELTKAFNAVAQALACLAYCPGGIIFGGHHWEARPGAAAPELDPLAGLDRALNAMAEVARG